jgi:hypothetical protein
MLSEQPTGEQSDEFTMPRFVAFARNGAEIIVGYMEQAIMWVLKKWFISVDQLHSSKRFTLRPWQQLERTSLYQKDLENAEASTEGPTNAYLCENVFLTYAFIADSEHRGNAVMLPRTKQLAVFNLHNGLDIYNFPELHGKREAQFDVDSFTTQGIAVLKSGSLLASPTRDGDINIIDCNASVIGVLRRRNNPLLQRKHI